MVRTVLARTVGGFRSSLVCTVHIVLQTRTRFTVVLEVSTHRLILSVVILNQLARTKAEHLNQRTFVHHQLSSQQDTWFPIQYIAWISFCFAARMRHSNQDAQDQGVLQSPYNSLNDRSSPTMNRQDMGYTIRFCCKNTYKSLWKYPVRMKQRIVSCCQSSSHSDPFSKYQSGQFEIIGFCFS